MILSTFCENSAGLKMIYYINNIIEVLFIIGPIFVILLVSIDFAKNVIAGNYEDSKKNLHLAIRRIGYGVVLFFVPLLVNIAFGLINNAGVNSLNCWNKVTLSQIHSAEKKEAIELKNQKAKEAEERQAQIEERLAKQEAAKHRSDLSETNTTATSGNKISETALKLAWPKGTKSSKWKYGSGSPTPEYKSALDKYYPKHKKWGAGPRVGASCDVFVGTSIRASGADPKVPRGLEGQFKYFPKSSKWKKVSSPTKSTVKGGDVILYYKNGGGAHASLVVEIKGKKYIAEAGLRSAYGHITNSVKGRLNTSGKHGLVVYRLAQ